MKIEIEVSDEYVEKMYNTYCSEKKECVDCPCQVQLNETYSGCNHKYVDIFFKNEFQEIIDKGMEMSSLYYND